MTVRHIAGVIIRKVFPGLIEFRNSQKEFQKLRIEHADSLSQIRKNTELSREEWIEKIKAQYKQAMGCELNLDNPSKLTEKIQYRKLFEHNPLYAKLTDKYAAREWVKEQIGEEYLIPLLGVWDRAEDIPFKSLPNEFVLKTNNGSGMNIIIRDKKSINRKMIVEQLDYWLKYPFWAQFGEFHYKDIKPKIIAEEYINQMDGDLLDYKIYCFDGNPSFIQVIGERDITRHTGRQAIYDFKWNRLPWTTETYPAFSHEITKPVLLDELYRIGKILSKGFGFVRVDLYIIDDQVKFGEMTFTPRYGIFPYRRTWTEELDLQYGKMMVLYP